MKQQRERMNFWEYLDSNPDIAYIAIVAAMAMVVTLSDIFNT